MSDPYLGEIRLVGFNFPPVGWALCNGAVLPISQYTALFSLLGTQYGGNGTSTFSLPNFQGYIPVGQGQLAGGGGYVMGNTGGSGTVAITTSTMPFHTHTLAATATAGRIDLPTSTSALGAPARGEAAPYALTATGNMNATTVLPVGSGNPHNNYMPTLAMYFIICMSGIFPARS